MVSMAWTGNIRPYRDSDLEFFKQMNLRAFYSGPRDLVLPFDEAMRNPFFAAWLVGWGEREHDTALIAENADLEAIGAAWYRCFPFENRSYGVLHPDIPEIGIAVVEDSCGAGVGTALLERLLSHAREHGFTRLSLSVDASNRARRLYDRAGFRDAGIIMALGIDD